MSRILLLHASVGMGHQRAATALAGGFGLISDAEVRVADTLDHARSLFRRMYAGLYLGIADHVPSFWSRFYDETDRPASKQWLITAARISSTSLGVRGLPELLQEVQPDAVICTHFLPLEVLGPLRLQELAPPLYCVVTDYRAHHFWACPGVDGYFVPTIATREQLVAAGIRRSQVHVTGIPIDPQVNKPLDRLAVRQVLGLSTRQPVVLFNGSGIARTRVRAIVHTLLEQAMPGTLVVAAGRNHELVNALSDLQSTTDTVLLVIGQQPSLDPFIAASDIVIGKAGGLTVSEVLGRGVPLVIPTPVPGQEQANADYVTAVGAGECHDTANGVALAVLSLLADTSKRTAMAAAARAAGCPASAQSIAAHVLADLRRGFKPVRLRPRAVTSTTKRFA